MTWWSEYSAVPRFVLAKLAIRCRFVDRFVGSRVPSRVSGQRFSAHGTFLPSVGSRRARFPVFIGTMKVLRLPARANLVPYGFGCRPPRPLPFRLRRSAPNEREGSSVGLEHLISRRSLPGMLHPWARAGSRRFPGDPSYAFALLQDPGRADKTSPVAVLPTPPPAYPNRRPQRVHNLEANTGLQHPLSTLHERRRRLPCKTRFRLAGCASTGRGSNPLDRFERFQVTLPFSFPGLVLSQGSSMPSDLLADPTPSSPTFPATHTALLLPTAGSSPSLASASLSNGRIIGPRATLAISL